MAVYRRVVTGVSTLILITKTLCKLLTKFRPKIDTWATVALSAPDKATLDTWLDAAQTVCLILETATDD